MNSSKINLHPNLARYLWLTVFSAIFALAIPTQKAAAQEYRATLTVNVTDSSGAAIPNAKVELTRGSTKQVTTGITDSGGSYI